MDKNRNITLTPEQLNKLKEYIKKEFGIALDDKQLLRAKKRLENVMISNGFELFLPFYHQLRFNKQNNLIQDLINAVTINETYFWREHEQFTILSTTVLPHIAKTKQHIRILVAPVSSGEELYSIMFSILDEANVIQKKDIEILGIDIDSNMINRAKEAKYSKRSIEKLPKKFLDKYFTKKNELYILDQNLSRSVKFLQANIFDKNFIKKLGKFDIIFSRNMLIYFDTEQKKEVLDIFYTMLDKDGILFLGHADANEIDRSKFNSYKKGLHVYTKI